MKLSTLKDLKKVEGKRVLVRVDFNVPLGKGGKIAKDADARIRATLPTIERLRAAGAKVILVSHLGRPKKREWELSLAPVAKRLSQLLITTKAQFVAEPIDSPAVDRKIGAMKDGDVTLLENIRYYKGEDENSPFLAKRLAALADVFVNDAFATAHREAASTVGVAKLLPSYAGLLFEKEYGALSKLDKKPTRPYTVMMGGAKLETKLPTLSRLLTHADTVLIGGGLMHAFFQAKGWSTGRSKASPGDVRTAKTLLRRYRSSVVLPTDVLVAKTLTDKAQPRYASPKDVRKDEYVVDVGAETVREWAGHIKKARTLVWNGPLGLFEVAKFSHGTIALGRLVAARSGGKAYGVVGGGETLQCLERTGMAEYVDHVSTAGGAMLEFLSGKTLPAIKPLLKKK